MFQNKIIFLLLLLSLTMFGNCSEEKKDNTALLAALALASSSSPAAGNPASETHVSLNRIYLTTSVITGGNLGGISGADARCSSDGNKPSTGTYKAMIVSGTTRRACSTANSGGGSSENRWNDGNFYNQCCRNLRLWYGNKYNFQRQFRCLDRSKYRLDQYCRRLHRLDVHRWNDR